MLKFHLIVKKCENRTINQFKTKLNKIYTGNFKKIKHRYVSYQKYILNFLKLNLHVALFILLEALKNSHRKKNLPNKHINRNSTLISNIESIFVLIKPLKIYTLLKVKLLK